MSKISKFNFIILFLIVVFVVSGCLKKVEVKPVVEKKEEVKVEEKKDEVVDVKIGDENQEVDTSDWLTYVNEKYGFEFKYPANLSVKDWASETPNYELLLYIGENNMIGDGFFDIGIDKGITKFNSETIMWPLPRKNLKIQDVIIGQNNYPAHLVSVYSLFADDINNTVDVDNFDRYYIDFNDKIYQITYDKEKTGELNKEIFENILKSFKFIDEKSLTENINTDDWLTYRNKELGVEFKYPNNWTVNFYNNKIRIKNTNKEIILGGMIPDDYTINPSKYENVYTAIDIYTYKDVGDLEWKVFFDSNLHNTVSKFETYKINNQITGVKITKLEGIMYGEPSLFFKEGKNIYSVHYINSYNNEKTELNKNNFDKILSTFNFTPLNQI